MASGDRRPIAFVSGCLGGIGADAVRYFHGKGYRLWLTARNRDKLEEFAAEFDKPILSVADLAVAPQLEALCQEIEGSAEPLSVALINAGVIVPGPVVSLSRADFDQQIDVNLRAAMHLNHAVARRMLKEKFGHIINIVSSGAFVSLRASVAYSATKFGQRGFLIGLADELQGTGVHVTGIYPGAIDTPMLEAEARHGGSVMNFVNEPSPTSEVVKVIDRALREKKEHYIFPKGDTLVCLLANVFPSFARRLYPKLEARGERGRQRYLKKIESRRG